MNAAVRYLWRQYMRVKHPSCTIHPGVLARQVTLEEKVTIEPGCYVGARRIGKCTYIGPGTWIDKGTDSIGRFCSIAMHVRIALKDHPMDRASTHPFTYHRRYGYVDRDERLPGINDRRTVIGHDVWIGANVTILSGVTVGNGAVIGAHSLVTRDVEPYSIVHGTPARHVRYRFDAATIERLQQLAWWDRDDRWLKEHLPLFRRVEDLVGVG